jgi:hypothetical protein
MAAYFCPKCWHEMGPDAGKCVSCGYDTAEYSLLSYEQKLLLALSHPIRENRLLAVQLLGELKSSAALPHFRAMLKIEDDFYTLREVLIALAKVETTEGRALVCEATRHESKIVRDFARLMTGSTR